MSGYYTNGLPVAVIPLTGLETIPMDTNVASGGGRTDLGDRPHNAAGGSGAPALGNTSGTIATNAALGRMFTVTLTGNATLSNPTNLIAGQELIYVITQDGTGSRLVTFGNLFTFVGNQTVSTPASSIDVIRALYDGLRLRAILTKAYA